MSRRRLFSLSSTLALLLVASSTFGRNVDLSTVPSRHSVQLTIYNSEDLTLVRETRAVTFKKGANPLQFSWANTLIDPTSVELRFLTNGDKLELLDTTYPHDKPQTLYWNVQSEADGEATIEITYFTSGITWAADYTCVADKDEKALHLDGFVRITNNSGEEYEDAHVRLVVGTINLVEKIAQLAKLPFTDVSSLNSKDAVYFETAKRAFDGPAVTGGAIAQSEAGDREKQVVKEGLSEYFIFSIEGTETIANGWSKRMRAVEGAAVPFAVQYRYRPEQYGDQLVRMYVLTNNTDSKLGTTPLPDGVVRVLRDNGRDGLSVLANQSIKYVPIGDKIELNLGVDPNVVFELVKLRASRDDIWARVRGANVFRRIDQPSARVELNSAVAGWDEHTLYAQRVRNYTGQSIDIEVRRPLDGDVTFRSTLKATLHDYRTPEFHATVDAGQRQDLLFEVVSREGNNRKQNRVQIEEAEVRR